MRAVSGACLFVFRLRQAFYLFGDGKLIGVMMLHLGIVMLFVLFLFVEFVMLLFQLVLVFR